MVSVDVKHHVYFRRQELEQVGRWVGPVWKDPSGSGDGLLDEHLQRRQLAPDGSSGIPHDYTVISKLQALFYDILPGGRYRKAMLGVWVISSGPWRCRHIRLEARSTQHTFCGGPV